MSTVPLDRLVRKEVALGAIRERPVPTDHIGLSIAPFLNVDSDDVIFEYIKAQAQDLLAPARAEDAEARLRQRDEFLGGVGRASVIDWSLKDKYTASDVTRYRDTLSLLASTSNVNVSLNPLQSAVSQFNSRLARDDASRKRSLDNRIEYLIMTALDTGVLTYSDGKIQFSVDYGRPADQTLQSVSTMWDAGVTHDPIADLKAAQQVLWTRYFIKSNRALISQKAIDTFWKSNRFVAAVAGVVGGTPSSPIDPNYMAPTWTNEAAIRTVEAATGLTFTVYDSVYQTRPIGSTTITNNRFTNEKMVLLLPDSATMADVDDTEIGFAKTLTSPHPEGNWQSGFYEWEATESDPWMHVKGSGIKAFPVFPYLKYTYQLKVLA